MAIYQGNPTKIKSKKFCKSILKFHSCFVDRQIILKYFDLNCIPFKMSVNQNKLLKIVFITDWFQITNKSDFLNISQSYCSMCVCVCLKCVEWIILWEETSRADDSYRPLRELLKALVKIFSGFGKLFEDEWSFNKAHLLRRLQSICSHLQLFVLNVY